MKSQAQALRTIKKIWHRKQELDPEVASLRKLALKLKISPGYLSKIFSGQKPIGEELARKFIKILSPDALSEKSILKPFEKLGSAKTSQDRFDLSVFEIAAEDAEWLLGKWYRTTLLDLMTLKNFVSDPKWMATQLNVPLAEIESSLTYLAQQGLAFQNKAGIWQKKHPLLRFPTDFSKKVIREHHKSNLVRAGQVLDAKVLPKDFQERLIVSFSVACNPEKLQAVKQKLHQKMYEAANQLSQGDCTQVYQLNLQLFPQTKNEEPS